MVARGRGKKAAAASEAVAAAVANGDVISQETEAAGTSVAASPPTKKGRMRGTKKEIREEVDESPPLEIVEKPTKPIKAASKGSKKATKGKAVIEEEEVTPVPVTVDEEKKIEELDEDDVPLIESKPAGAEKKTHHRKKKADSTEKIEEIAPVAKKVPRTKTKAAKKETVDSAGLPEDPAATLTPVLAETQTNGNKKSTSRKRTAPKIEEQLPVEDPIKEDDEEDEQIDEAEVEIAPPPAKRSSKSSRGSKKETKRTAPKTKGSRKALKEEDAPEDDILPEDEFVPEEEEEEPKVKKLVKSKGSRKQLKDDIPSPVEEEVPVIKEPIVEQQDSEVESAIEEEKKSKGKKPPPVKKTSTKKVTSKKTSRAKKGTKDEVEELITEEQDAAEIETTDDKANGNTKAKTEQVEKKLGRSGRKRAATTPIEEVDEADGSKSAKPEVFLNPTVTDYNGDDFSIDKDFKLKISSWNVAGLRSWLKKNGLQYLQYEQPDIVCLQEIKCTTDQLPEEARIPGYHPYWLCMPGGHAGVAVYSKIMPINVEYGIGNAEHDDAGRMITAEYEKFYLICVYVPNSGRKLVNLEKRMAWEELFREYVQRLDKIKPVIIAGDMNVSHNEIDLANPKTNTKNAGFTVEERDAMTKLFELGYVDTFRHLYPKQKGAYSFWSYMGKARSKNVGWRLDYFIVSERITTKVVDSTIRAQVLGSDHCPITLFLTI